MLVPEGVAAFTCRTRREARGAVHRERAAVGAGNRAGAAHWRVRFRKSIPPGGVIDWKFVFGGVVCVKVIPRMRHCGTVIRDALRVSDVASRRHRIGGRGIRRNQIRLLSQWRPHLQRWRCCW